VTDRRANGELERAVLTCLWSTGTPMSAADVRLAMDAGLAYTTVMTILSRLHDKQLVEREAVGRAFYYRPLVGPDELAARRMRAALADGARRLGTLTAFVDELPPADVDALRAALERSKPRRRR
jgi:predicted transcriptional regulator